jgi:hypothetical protein
MVCSIIKALVNVPFPNARVNETNGPLALQTVAESIRWN